VGDVLSKVKIWMPGIKATASRSDFLVWFARQDVDGRDKPGHDGFLA
jgi:hypothetical protein